MSLHLHRKLIGGLTDVVDDPERFETRRERSPHKVIITVSIAGVLLCGVVSAGVSWVIRRILLLAKLVLLFIVFKQSFGGFYQPETFYLNVMKYSLSTFLISFFKIIFELS